MTRDALIARFLENHGYGAASPAPLAQDASFRRYLRLTGGPRPAVLMDAPPPEDVRPFLRIAAHLAAIGLSVPDIIAADPDSGLVLEEDLGDALFAASWPGASSSWPGLTRPSTPDRPCAGGRVKPGHDDEALCLEERSPHLATRTSPANPPSSPPPSTPWSPSSEPRRRRTSPPGTRRPWRTQL